MKKFLPLLALLITVISCKNSENEKTVCQVQKDFTHYVNSFIGTSKMGHVFPGATAPFGMVQLSPQTNFVEMFDEEGRYNGKTYEYCAGYQYADSIIIGFAHTNFSGTGHSDLGDLLVMPVSGRWSDGVMGNKGDGEKWRPGEAYFSHFSHENEHAEPGYYSVYLDDCGIEAELTASERVGFHRYTFTNDTVASIVLDMIYNVYHYDGKNVWTFIRVENDTLLTGYRQTRGWARDRKVFFAIAFSEPIKEYGFNRFDDVQYNGFYRRFNEFENFPEMAGNNIRARFDFDVKESEQIQMKVALSPVSMAGALKNMQAEIPHWDFERVKTETSDKWNAELARVDASFINDNEYITFYTALYHSFLTPILYEDVDGQYRGLDQNIHTSDGFTNYTIFSLWDTYRALHPLFNMLQPSRNNDMIKSMLAHQDQSVHNMLPIWSHYANENWCMIGYHAVSVIADAMVKGVGNFDRERALQACMNTATVEYFEGLGDYMEYGYVPDNLSHSSVSKTLEYAYDDWCIAQIAKNCENKAVEDLFLERSRYYKNVYDESIGFMRPRLSDGRFREDFDPMDTHGQGFIEGNAWNYGLYVPQYPEEMIMMMGGKEAFSARLDKLFTMDIDDKYIEKHEDITRDGIIGNYVHGNEPGHHIPYLYNWTDDPHKTQERVRMIMNTMYGPTVEGLCGNDDAGQMSAWYIFSALGFYPLCPGSEYYAIGSPLVETARLRLGNGKTLTIIAENQSPENVYVQDVSLNGKTIKGNLISHHDLMEGGELVFEMSKDLKNEDRKSKIEERK